MSSIALNKYCNLTMAHFINNFQQLSTCRVLQVCLYTNKPEARVFYIASQMAYNNHHLNRYTIITFLHNFGHHFQLPFICCPLVSLGNSKCMLNLR